MSAIEKRNRILVWTAGGLCLLAAVWLGTGIGGFRNDDPTSAKPADPGFVANGISSDPKTDSGKLHRRRAEEANVKSPDNVRLERKLRSLYDRTLGARQLAARSGTFDESVHLPDFKEFVEVEGVRGIKALSELYTELRASDNAGYHYLQFLLKKVLHDSYKLGEIESMVDIINAIHSGDSSKDRSTSESLLNDLMSSFGPDQVNSVRIFEEISTTIPAQEYGQYFGTIAGHAGRWIGYDKALAMLPNDPAFGETVVAESFNSLVVGWFLRDANECRGFIDSLPQGAEKNRYLSAFARALAFDGKLDEAEDVLAGLPSNLKEVREAREAIKYTMELRQK